MTTEEINETLNALQRHSADTAYIEAKRSRDKLPKRLWETLSAFSNSTGGGIIVLGVSEEDNFKPTGVAEPGKIQADLAAVCSDQMDPPLRPLVQLFDIGDQTIVVAEIPELSPDQKPCYYKGAGLPNGAFVRVADGDRHLTPYEVHAFLENRAQPHFDAEPLPGTSISDLDDELVHPLLTRLREREGAPYQNWSDERLLQALQVIVPDEKGRLVSSLMGWLCFSRFPQERFPNLCLTFTRFPTIRPGERGPAGERFLDNVKIEGPLPHIVVESLRVLKRHMKRRGIVEGLFREDLWEYPESVIREAIVNALGHRDLSPRARGSQIQVRMFPDRLEISNPGGLFGPISPDELGRVGIQSSRNASLMRILEDLPPSGERRPLCENRGTGLSSMLEQMRFAGMSPPRFGVKLTHFRLILPNHTLYESETLEWLGDLATGSPLSESQRQALAFLRHSESLNNADYCRITGVDSRVATRELTDLVDRGILQRSGSGRWTVYELLDESETSEQKQFAQQLEGKADRAREIIHLLGRKGPMSARKIGDETGLSGSAVRYWLRKLRKSRDVVPTSERPTDPTMQYRLPDGGG